MAGRRYTGSRRRRNDGRKISQIIETVSSVQNSLYSLISNEDSKQLNILKIGTVFQIFFIGTLASGKKPGDLTKDDWKNIADKVNKYAVLEEDQKYSEYVFNLYLEGVIIL